MAKDYRTISLYIDNSESTHINVVYEPPSSKNIDLSSLSNNTKKLNGSADDEIYIKELFETFFTDDMKTKYSALTGAYNTKTRVLNEGVSTSRWNPVSWSNLAAVKEFLTSHIPVEKVAAFNKKAITGYIAAWNRRADLKATLNSEVFNVKFTKTDLNIPQVDVNSSGTRVRPVLEEILNKLVTAGSIKTDDSDVQNKIPEKIKGKNKPATTEYTLTDKGLIFDIFKEQPFLKRTTTSLGNWAKYVNEHTVEQLDDNWINEISDFQNLLEIAGGDEPQNTTKKLRRKIKN